MEVLLQHMIAQPSSGGATLNYVGQNGNQVSLNSASGSQTSSLGSPSSSLLGSLGLSSQPATGGSSLLSSLGLSPPSATGGSQASTNLGQQLGLGAGFGNSIALDVYAAALAKSTTPNPLLDPYQLSGVLSGQASGGVAQGAPADLTWLQNYIPQLALAKHGKVAVVKKLNNTSKTKAFISKTLSV